MLLGEEMVVVMAPKRTQQRERGQEEEELNEAKVELPGLYYISSFVSC